MGVLYGRREGLSLWEVDSVIEIALRPITAARKGPTIYFWPTIYTLKKYRRGIINNCIIGISWVRSDIIAIVLR